MIKIFKTFGAETIDACFGMLLASVAFLLVSRFGVIGASIGFLGVYIYRFTYKLFKGKVKRKMNEGLGILYR
jgi:hypothetical protein